MYVLVHCIHEQTRLSYVFPLTVPCEDVGKYQLLSLRVHNKASLCGVYRTRKTLSLSACAEEACANNVNTFNYRDNQCRLDDCTDEQNMLTDTLGGYDVYIYAGAETTV